MVPNPGPHVSHCCTFSISSCFTHTWFTKSVAFTWWRVGNSQILILIKCTWFSELGIKQREMKNIQCWCVFFHGFREDYKDALIHLLNYSVYILISCYNVFETFCSQSILGHEDSVLVNNGTTRCDFEGFQNIFLQLIFTLSICMHFWLLLSLSCSLCLSNVDPNGKLKFKQAHRFPHSLLICLFKICIFFCLENWK